MKKAYLLSLLILVPFIVGCSNSKLLEEAKGRVNEYNNEMHTYNETINQYNEDVVRLSEANMVLEDKINEAKDVIHQGETPYDTNTLDALNLAVSNAEKSLVTVPDLLDPFEEMEAPQDDYNSKKLQQIIDDVDDWTSVLHRYVMPEALIIPDYSSCITEIDNALEDYNSSVQILNQITAPSDEFVMVRLQRVDCITNMEACTEEHDMNDMLHKQGGYIGCIAFRITQIPDSELTVFEEEGESISSPIDCGTDGGGCIEIYANVDDATTRNQYLGIWGTMSGFHEVFGTMVIRVSGQLTATQQYELASQIKNALLEQN